MRSFATQPKLLWPIAFGQLWDTFSYFGTQTILALYFIDVFHLDRIHAYLLYGAYAAFAFTMPTLGGYIADHCLGAKYTARCGCFLGIVGNLILMSLHRYYFCLGIAVTLIGSGLYKGTTAYLVGTLYEENKSQKETGYTLLYIAINVGGTLAPLAYGLAIRYWGWNYGFLLSGCGIFLGTLWFLSKWEQWEEAPVMRTQFWQTSKIIYPSIAAICGALSLVFYYFYLVTPVLIVLFILGIIYLLSAFRKYHGKAKQHLYGLFVVSFFTLFYYAAGLQVGTTITLFIKQSIQTGLLQFHLQPSALSALYCFFVLVLSPFSIALWKRFPQLNVSYRLAIGIVCATAGILFFALASLAHTDSIVLLILLGYAFLSAGELSLTPPIYTAISNLSPVGMKNTMMGCWLLFVALGGYSSSILASMSHYLASISFAHMQPFFGEFLFIAVFTLLTAVVLFFLSRRLGWLLS